VHHTKRLAAPHLEVGTLLQLQPLLRVTCGMYQSGLAASIPVLCSVLKWSHRQLQAAAQGPVSHPTHASLLPTGHPAPVNAWERRLQQRQQARSFAAPMHMTGPYHVFANILADQHRAGRQV